MHFFVGAYSSFQGREKSLVKKTQVKILEKLGHSSGRAKRFLETHKVTGFVEAHPGEDGKVVPVPVLYRPIVFQMPNGFRLRNDVVQAICRELKCDWMTAKFHAYRIAAVDVVGNKEDFPELFPPEKPTTEEPQPQPEATATPDANAPVTEGPVSVDPAAEETCPAV